MARAMKDSGIEWIGEIPEEWKRVKLGFLYSFSSGNTLTAQDFDDRGDYPVFGANGLRGYYNSYNTSGKHILIGRVGALCGNIHLINSEVWVTEHALISEKLSSLIADEFSVYLFTAMGLRQYASGTAQPVIAAEKIRKLSVPLPPMNEQQRIASFLDSECARIDAVIEQTRASIEEYKKLKQSVITQAVTKGIRPSGKMKDSGVEWIGEIPEEWNSLKIKWLLDERNERSEHGLEEPLSMSQKYGLIPTKEMDMVPNMASSFVGAKVCYPGDLVFNKLKAHLGVFALSKFHGLVSPDYAVYHSRGIANLKYLEYLFKTPQYIAEFKKKSTGVGAGLTRLYTAGLYSIYSTIPPLSEQSEIVEYLDEKTEEISALIRQKEGIITELESYKKSLIYEYVTGKKEVPV